MISTTLALVLRTIPEFTLIAQSISNATDQCYATTEKVTQGPHTIPKALGEELLATINPNINS